MEETAEELARRCAAAMWTNDSASKGLGIEVTEIGPGQAPLEMVISGLASNAPASTISRGRDRRHDFLPSFAVIHG